MPQETCDPSRPLRVAFIGGGGVLNHQVPQLLRLPNVIPFAVADVWEPSLQSAQEKFGFRHGFADYRRMLAELPEIDAVSVCTPNCFHAEHTIAALQAGKHVLVEKPMATTVADAERMAEAARASGKQLVVGFQQRFDPKVQMIHRQIQAGDFGKILYVRAQALRRRGIPSWGCFGKKEMQGGGPLVDIGVHVLEAAHYLLGSPEPQSALGATFQYLGNQPCAAEAPWGAWNHSAYDVEDLAVGTIRFANDAILTIEASFAAHIEQDTFNIQVFGERGGAESGSGKIFTDRNGYMMTATPAFVADAHPFEYKMRHFVEVARGQRYNEVPPEAGLAVQKMIDALYRSAQDQPAVKNA